MWRLVKAIGRLSFAVLFFPVAMIIAIVEAIPAGKPPADTGKTASKPLRRRKEDGASEWENDRPRVEYEWYEDEDGKRRRRRKRDDTDYSYDP